MTHVVAKPFKTVNRRFAVGAEVRETDDLAPHAFADLKERGFIALPAAPANEPARASSPRMRGAADKSQ